MKLIAIWRPHHYLPASHLAGHTQNPANFEALKLYILARSQFHSTTPLKMDGENLEKEIDGATVLRIYSLVPEKEGYPYYNVATKDFGYASDTTPVFPNAFALVHPEGKIEERVFMIP